MVSGNDGDYYCPFFFSSICNSCAIWDMKPTSMADLNDIEFRHLADWYTQNKALLSENGIDGLKTDIEKGFRTIDELISAYDEIDRRTHIDTPRKMNGS